MRSSRDRKPHWRLPIATVAALLLALSAAGPAARAAGKNPSFKDAVKNGKVTVNLRYRFETVADDGPDQDARASTLRTALGYQTRFYKGFSFEIEAENVTAIGNDLYDNIGFGRLNNRMPRRSVVADPAVTEINQALLRYRGDRWRLALGRQEIVLGDARFVGNVGWRQNHQNFDALRIDNDALGGLRLTYAYVDNVNRITGDGRDLAAHLLNVGFRLQNAGTFTLYGYLVDWQDPGLSRLSTATWGLEFAGQRRLAGGRSLLYEAELADQSDYADNDRPVEAGYHHLMLGLGLPRLTIKLSHETLEGGAGGQFQTILATLHKWNGWADKFSSTPFLGLVDLNLQINGKVGPVAWLVRYHEFESAERSLAYGTELDLQLLYTTPQEVALGVKAALYDADLHSFDTDKWMVWAAYGF